MTDLVIHHSRFGTAERTLFGFKTKEFPRLDRFQNALSAGCAWIAGAAIIALALVTTLEVAMREFFSQPLGWNISLTEKYLLPCVAFFGLITTYRTSTHIAVETLFHKFSPRIQKIILIAIHASIAFSLFMVAIAGAQETWIAFDLGHQTLPGMADLPFPDWTYRIIVPIAALLGTILAAIDLFRELITPWNRPFTDYDPGESED